MNSAAHRLALDLTATSRRAMTEAGMESGGLRMLRPRAALARAGMHDAMRWVKAPHSDNATTA